MAQARLECSVKKHPRESARWKTLTFWPFSWPTVYNSVWDVDLIASIHLREGLFLLARHAQVFHAFPCRQYNSYLLGCSNCTDTAAGPYLASFTWGNYMCAPCWAVFCRHRDAQVLRASRRGGSYCFLLGHVATRTQLLSPNVTSMSMHRVGAGPNTHTGWVWGLIPATHTDVILGHSGSVCGAASLNR